MSPRNMMRNKIAWSVCTILACTVSVFAEEYPSTCPEIVKKSMWDGRPATIVNYCLIPVQHVVVHHTVTSQCTTGEACSQRLRSMQNYHMDTLQFRDIGYNFLVGGDGRIYEGTGWHKQGAHTKSYNSISLGLAFIGDFSNELPNDKQLNAAKAFLECAVKIQELDVNYKLIGASQVRSTNSPGQKLFNEIKKWRHFDSNPKKG